MPHIFHFPTSRPRRAAGPGWAGTLALGCALGLVSPALGATPPRAYPDAYQLKVDREEVYNGSNDWTIYYSAVDWENFLIYLMVLSKKGYAFEGGTPQWVSNYIDYLETDRPAAAPVELVAYKKGWAKLHIRYVADGARTPGGKSYTMSTKIRPGPDIVAGRKGTSLNPEDYEPYVEHRSQAMKAGAKD